MKTVTTLIAALLLAVPAARAQEEAAAAEEKAEPKQEEKAEPEKKEEKAEEEKAEPKQEEKAEPEKKEEKAEEDKAEPKHEEKAEKHEEKAEKHEKAAAKKGGGDAHGYVDAALGFLKGLARSARKGDEGKQAWEMLKEHAGDKVALKIAGKGHDIDVAGHKSDARLLKFAKLSAWREGAHVKGVHLELMEFKVGGESHKGKGSVAMEEKDGKWTVTSIEVE